MHVEIMTLSVDAGTCGPSDAILTARSSTERQLLHCPATADEDAFRLVTDQRHSAVVQLPAPHRDHIGRFGEFVRASIERHLKKLGASAGTSHPDDSLESYLKDALYRVRLLGAGGLALAFANLNGLADEEQTLNEYDSRALRTLLACVDRHGLLVYFPPSTTSVCLLGAPVPLSECIPTPPQPTRMAAIEYETLRTGPTSNSPLPRPPSEEPDTLAAPVVEKFVVGANLDTELEPKDSAPMAATSERDPERDERCRAWAHALNNMAGPKVHGAVERAFSEAYVPLHHEVAAGHAPEESAESLRRWGEDFAQSYSAAFDQMQRHSRRPRMVMDIANLAARWAEHHRVARCELLVVSGMRFDLGELLRANLSRSLSDHALCIETSVLWAALPSNSRSQPLEQGHDSRSARAFSPVAPEPGHMSSPPQRLHRLDTLDQELALSGEAAEARLERLSTSLEGEITPWMKDRKPGTLVVVFGDHGFSLERAKDGTGPAAIGGALPEQVLVPAAGWIVGARRPRSREPGPTLN